MGIDYYYNSSTSIRIHAVVHRAFYLLHFQHDYCCNNSSVVLRLIHRYNAVRGHRTGSDNLYSSSSVRYARNIVRLFLDETHARGAQIRYIYVTRTYVWLFGECLYHRPLGVWLF